ncbi:SbcC/MukB-like Walker B domain-containing protein [Tunicatimonas pelagia]|uniref:SbcC/MukB-like Walker B domain-containing protein n=1 Tax=Tunicatimonas pelagia TaxID=931531 RepID=UPI002665AAD1|nr:SMC family ATPase [Tunicatimonas pelagia]WKN42951.1 SMC family ATPase [Tunicatimonas pelagia]
MIPVHLTFSGLYSYQKKQSIDFEKLMAAQLFGIFGSVGSGKSSILEAIMFVLFDRSDRLNKSGDNRYYNMLNLQSTKLEIDFTFRANAKSNTKYRAYFSAQRKKRDFEKVEVKDRGFYEWKDDQWVPLPNGDAAQLLGITYENFMQTVIIPQGKFREFIDQRPNVRTQMLKDLFQLHRFDLGAKTGLLLRKTETAITDLQARLLEIGQISEEDIIEQQQVLKTAEAELLRKQQLAIQLDQQCQKLDALKKLLDKIDDTDTELKQLTAQSEHFNDKEKQLRAYTKAETFFNEKFRLLEDTTVEAQQAQQELDTLKGRIEVGSKKTEQLNQEVVQKKEAYEQREQIHQQCQDLLHLIEIKKAQPRRQQLTDSLTQIEQQQRALERSITEQQAQLEEYENQLLAAEDERNQWLVLKEVANWVQRREELVAEQQSVAKQVYQYEQQLSALAEKYESILTAHGWPESSQPDTLNDDFAQFQTNLHQQQDTANKELSELRLQERLTQAASQLTPGQPCMLCGSTEHPRIIHSPSVKKALSDKQEELAELRRKETSFRELQRDIQQLSSQDEAVRKMLGQEQKRAKELGEKQAKHEALHHWPEFKSLSGEEINRQLEIKYREQQKAQQWQQMRQQGQKKLKELQQKLEHQRSQQQTLLQQQTSLQATEEQRQSMLQVYQISDFQDTAVDKMQKTCHQKQTQLTNIEQQYEQAQQTLQEYQNALGLLEGRYEALQENQQKLSQKAESLNEEIQALCTEKEFDNLGEIRKLIDLELDIDAENQVILTYRNRRHNAEVTLHKLQAELQGQQYDPQEHRQLQLKAQSLTLEVRQQQEQCALLRQQIRDWQSKRARTQTIQQELAQQQLRESNLKELASLFRGSGFVKYASTVLLENLCLAANQRFMKLTQNSLSLELNEENEFVVRDYLNDGKTRLLKTLSGGQTFQASLCLALALAENVKSLNQAEQSFFFLDEGFGSLDRESLRVVFDTLKSLRKENRIVGIISHVEDMQHEIDVYLTITRDRQHGSQIQASWEA